MLYVMLTHTSVLYALHLRGYSPWKLRMTVSVSRHHTGQEWASVLCANEQRNLVGAVLLSRDLQGALAWMLNYR
jgi:hypothetical protein